MLINAARQYSGAEYKFYNQGFFKYKREGNVFFIEDIYIVPEFRGSDVSKMIMQNFETFMQNEGIIMYYGNVYEANPKALKKFVNWNMECIPTNKGYTIVRKMVNYGHEE